MVVFQDLAAQLKSLCCTGGKDTHMAPPQIIDCQACSLTLQAVMMCMPLACIGSFMQWRVCPCCDRCTYWTCNRLAKLLQRADQFPIC